MTHAPCSTSRPDSAYHLEIFSSSAHFDLKCYLHTNPARFRGPLRNLRLDLTFNSELDVTGNLFDIETQSSRSCLPSAILVQLLQDMSRRPWKCNRPTSLLLDSERAPNAPASHWDLGQSGIHTYSACLRTANKRRPKPSHSIYPPIGTLVL
jgi:hypothetical protein